jgi:hypothetical protein
MSKEDYAVLMLLYKIARAANTDGASDTATDILKIADHFEEGNLTTEDVAEQLYIAIKKGE